VLGRLDAHARARPGDAWIQGHGFDQDRLAERRFPTRDDLDRVSRTRPVLVSRVCGHAVVVNSAALALVTDAERACRRCRHRSIRGRRRRAVLPPRPAARGRGDGRGRAAGLPRRAAHRHHVGPHAPRHAGTDGRLRPAAPRRPAPDPRHRDAAYAAAAGALHAHGVNSTFGDDRLRFGAAKLFSDGSLGAHTALLDAPYADRPDTTGVRIHALRI
jgi:predicted amidohydrolase YtcJ